MKRLWFFVLVTTLAGCGDDLVSDGAGDAGVDALGDDAPSGEMIEGVTVDCESVDFDDDGLPDCEEDVLGTSPRTDDTDGDGLLDFEEVVDRNFDPESNNFRFNPRIADVPRLSFELTSLPDIQILFTASEGTAETISVERTQESARSVTTSESTEVSHSIEESITTEASISLLDAGFSVSGSLSESWGESMSWTSSQTRENRSAVSRARETSRQQGTELTGGTLRVTLAVENRGYQSVTLESLVVAASQSDPAVPGEFIPVANLDFESSQGFAPIEIPPNGATSDQLIFSTELDLGTALELLGDARNLILQPSVWSAVDIDDRSFNAHLETIGTKCARVEIDYGPGAGGGGRPPETYFVSAVTDFSSRSITAREALEDILRIPIEADADGVDTVRDVSANVAIEGRWAVTHTTSDGVESTRTIYDPMDQGANVDELELRPGWVLQLTYVEDSDGDGLLARSEFLAGASDDDPDSDDDGLDDFFEARVGWEIPFILDQTRHVFSSPAAADLDIDGLDDAAELAGLTDPREEDSDRDGIRDDLDDDPNDVSPLVALPLNGDTDATIGDAWQNDGATPTTDRFGQQAGALAFDGSSDISTDALFTTVHTIGASWSLWIRPDDLAPDVDQGVLDHDVGDAWNALWVSPEGIGGSGSSFGRHFIGLVEGTGNVTGAWHHVVGVMADLTDEVNDADTFQLYYDGELRGEIYSPSGPTLLAAPGPWTVGAGVGRTGFPPFVGGVDDLYIFSRGLTVEEVHVLFEQGQ